MNGISDALDAALRCGVLMSTAHTNIRQFMSRPGCEGWERLSIDELVARELWTELNDRFYRKLEFGTGGLRGRTVGRYVTKPEIGCGSAEAPDHPAVGTNTINAFTVSVATRGLAKYIMERFPGEAPRVAIAYDPRHSSHQFR